MAMPDATQDVSKLVTHNLDENQKHEFYTCGLPFLWNFVCVICDAIIERYQ